MIERTAHRGPDGQRFFGWPEAAPVVALGHARLSIVDPAHGWQPLSDETGRTWVVANGEIYNHQALRAELERRGHRFSTGSDTEAALHLLEETASPGDLDLLASRWASAVARLDGMYALAVWRGDESGGGWLVLARDPIGIRPLYWGWGDGAVYFGSEIKAIREVAERYEAFPPGRAAVFRVQPDGTVLGPAWARTYRFPWERQEGRPRRHGVGQASDGPLADAEAVERLEALLREAVAKRLMADAPVGVLLSGGLDSSLVAALARERYEGTLHSFAVGTPGSPDLEASERVARALGTVHHVRTFSDVDAERLLPSVIYHLESFDAPLVRSALANYLVFEAASAHVKVVLTGEGSDELFAGYASLEGLEGSALDAELARLMQLLPDTNLQRADRMGLAFGVEARVPFLDLRLVEWAFSLPPSLKRRTEHGRSVDKWVVRRLAARVLPSEVAAIADRPKQKFSQGSGAAGVLARLAERLISDAEWRRLQARYPEVPLGSREQALYLRLFLDFYPEPAARRAVRLTRSVVPGEVA